MIFLFLSLVLSINNRPIIGIVTVGFDGGQYIAASYVKWLEMAGSRTLPLFITEQPSKLNPILSQINGVLFTGGGAGMSSSWGGTYKTTINYILDFAKASYNSGDPYPIWGTCLGFERSMEAESKCGCDRILSKVDAKNITLPVDFTTDADISQMFPSHSSISQIARKIFSSTASTQNEHSLAVLETVFHADTNLSSKFNVLGTSKDRKGATFVAIVESKQGQPPMYGIQFHPEKVTFEWGTSNSVPHDSDSVMANNYLASFYVDQCRESKRTMPDDVYNEYSIWNYNPRFSGKTGEYYQQRYEFSEYQVNRFFTKRIHGDMLSFMGFSFMGRRVLLSFMVICFILWFFKHEYGYFRVLDE